MAGAHLDVSIQDAIRNNADGALVCYTQLPAKYGDGCGEGVEVASKCKRRHWHCPIQSHIANVMRVWAVACSIKESFEYYSYIIRNHVMCAYKKGLNTCLCGISRINTCVRMWQPQRNTTVIVALTLPTPIQQLL